MPSALLSVYNKDGIVDFARALIEMGWTIYSSGGTALKLTEAGLQVIDVATIVGPPILGHRVATLSRELHAALLARDTDADRVELQRLGVPRLDLVCVDMYPLEAEIARSGCTLESVLEKTDIGGPCLLRSAGKGRRIVVCDVDDRSMVIRWLKEGQQNTERFIGRLATKAELVVARYCSILATYLSQGYYHAAFLQGGVVVRNDVGIPPRAIV